MSIQGSEEVNKTVAWNRTGLSLSMGSVYLLWDLPQVT